MTDQRNAEDSFGHSAPTTAGRDGAHSRLARGSAIGLCLLLGLVARLGLLAAAPHYSYLWDHLDFMVWSEWAHRFGPTTLYDLPPKTLVNTNLPRYLNSRPMVTPCPSINRCNYPPLAGYLFWLQGWLWRVTDPPIETHEVLPHMAEFAGIEGGRLQSPVANTITTRAINAALPTLADFLMAWGVARLVQAIRRRPAGWAEVSAFALTVLGPPILLNSAFWTQMDACLACLLVWCVHLLARRQHTWAGVCFGAALMTKAQAILLIPVLCFIFLASIFARGGSWRRALQMWKTAAAAVLVVAVLAAPYALANRGHPERGWLRWYYRAYEVPIRTQFALTTLRAFNVWWLDYLAHKQDPAALQPDTVVFGAVTKERVGQVLLAVAAVAAAAACAWRWKWDPQSWVAAASLVLLAAFVFPTRVHERYLYYCLPFLIAAAVVFRPWLPVLVTLFVVAGFELTWFLWLAPLEAGQLAPAQSPDAAVGSLVLAVLTVASFGYALATVILWPPRP